ncbi:MAG: DUF4145 domain-containing protein [Eggerthellaceae bacterium]|jgi:hypothetical protein|nr:DUF4145 domain-containing protein [Eggerthellaceae bacterium]MDR2721482.1 DUF4145 domain-containing protein [Coriobacteriaceae bacterium]
MGAQVFIDAYAKIYNLHERSRAAAQAGLYDAAAFYMRKIIEVITDSFLNHYANTGNGWMFEQFCWSNGHDRPSLDDKIDFLLLQSNIPQTSRNTYDAVRQYGNAAVHKVDFQEGFQKHFEMMRLLEVEIKAFYQMAMG